MLAKMQIDPKYDQPEGKKRVDKHGARWPT